MTVLRCRPWIRKSTNPESCNYLFSFEFFDSWVGAKRMGERICPSCRGSRIRAVLAVDSGFPFRKKPAVISLFAGRSLVFSCTGIAAFMDVVDLLHGAVHSNRVRFAFDRDGRAIWHIVMADWALDGCSPAIEGFQGAVG
jgi:hypothetical protein